MEADGRRSGPGSKGRFGSYRTRRFSWKRSEGEPEEPKDEDERIPDDGAPTTMEAAVGNALLGAGPMVTVGVCLGKKPVLPLVAMATSFVHLTALVVAAAPWKLAQGSLDGRNDLLVGMLLTIVAVQEGTRWGIQRAKDRAEEWLDEISKKQGLGPLQETQRLHIALAIGYGHGITTTLFFFLGLLPVSFSGGTFYVESCPQIDFFTLAACCSLAFALNHTFSSAVYTNGCRTNNLLHKHLPPALHLTMALLTAGNLLRGGCLAVLPLLFLFALVPSLLTWKIYWTSGEWTALPETE